MKITASISITMILSLVALTAAAQVASDFTTDNEGWNIAGLAHQGPYEPPLTTHAIVFHSSGGNPGGYVSFTDTFSEDVAFFDAPAKFLGDQSAMYGGVLLFDMIVGPSPTYDDADVVLVGGGMVLVFDIARQSSTAWTDYSVLLTETAGWRVGGLAGLPPTQAQFQTALSSVTALRIRADDNSDNGDRTDLDNVALIAGCPPASIRVSEVEICWPSLSNAVYQVEYRSDLTTNTWLPLFTNIIATGQETCVNDTIVRGTPQRYYRVVCPGQ